MRGDRGVGSRDRLAGAVDDPAPVAVAARGAAGADAPAREDPAPAALEERVTRRCGCWLACRTTSPALRRRLLGWAGGSACDKLPGGGEEEASPSGKPLVSWAGSPSALCSAGSSSPTNSARSARLSTSAASASAAVNPNAPAAAAATASSILEAMYANSSGVVSRVRPFFSSELTGTSSKPSKNACTASSAGTCQVASIPCESHNGIIARMQLSDKLLHKGTTPGGNLNHSGCSESYLNSSFNTPTSSRTVKL